MTSRRPWRPVRWKTSGKGFFNPRIYHLPSCLRSTSIIGISISIPNRESMMSRIQFVGRSRRRGTALVIVLAFILLLTGLLVAYLSLAKSDRQLAASSFNGSKVDQLAG